MEWLEAAAAFSVVMMVFSTLATVVLETFHRLFQLREKGLSTLIGQMYSQVIIPQLKRQVTDVDAKTFQEKTTQLHGKTAGKRTARYWPLLGPIGSVESRGTQLKELSTAGFIERLAQTEEGQALYLEGQRKGRTHLNRTIKEIASKYEAFGDSASQFFQRRSLLVSCIVGLFLAFLLNLNVVQLFTTLLTDQKVRVALIQQGDQAAENLQNALTSLEASKINNPDDEEHLMVIRTNLQNLRSSESTITAYGIPIGWKTAPWMQAQWNGCSESSSILSLACGVNVWNVLKWFFYVFLGGLLVGLGGPFWFDTFTRLSGLVRRVRNPQTPVQQAKEDANGSKATAAAATPLNLPKVFEEAALVALTAHLSGRSALDTDGSVIREVRS